MWMYKRCKKKRNGPMAQAALAHSCTDASSVHFTSLNQQCGCRAGKKPFEKDNGTVHEVQRSQEQHCAISLLLSRSLWAGDPQMMVLKHRSLQTAIDTIVIRRQDL